MFKRGLYAGVLLLVMVSTAHAAATITLTALTPENSVGGYLPATLVDFQVDISQDTGSVIQLRGVQLDFAASDSGLTLLGDFDFDFSQLIANALYAPFPSYPLPALFYTSTAPIPGFILEIPTSGSLTLGEGRLELPTNPGTYLLDALNAGTNDTNRGAQIHFDFFSPTQWSSWDDSISGDSLALKVVPLPSTILILGSGLVGLAGLRKKLKK
jgi:hypothetical protein